MLKYTCICVIYCRSITCYYKPMRMYVHKNSCNQKENISALSYFHCVFFLAYFWKFEFYFMKTNIPVYGNIRCVYTILRTLSKIDYTLRCLEYICSVYSPLRRHGFLLGLLIAKTLTNVLYLLHKQVPLYLRCLLKWVIYNRRDSVTTLYSVLSINMLL